MQKRKNGMPRSVAFGIDNTPPTKAELAKRERQRKAFEELRKIDEEFGDED